MDKAKIQEYDKYLERVSQRISFLLVNPINSQQEQEQFFKDKRYEPQLNYEDVAAEFEGLRPKLAEKFLNTSLIANLLNQKRDEYIKKIEMITRIGSPSFSSFSVNVYGLPDDILVQKAYELLKMEEDEEDRSLPAEDVAIRFREIIDRYGFSWDVELKEMPATAAVLASSKKIFIKKDAKFSPAIIKRLIVHEIGTHVLRAENGWLQPYCIFGRGFPNYMGTEEGLAVVNEELAGVLSSRTLRTYAGRVIAVNMAVTKSFRQIYDELLRYFDMDSAWKMALRAKRGLTDTGKPGGLTKDYLYLDGYYKIKKFLDSGNDISKLYYGKIGIEHIAMVEAMDDLIGPKFLPSEM